MNMRRHTLFALLSVLALCACNNYLDIKPYGKTIPKTSEEFSELLNTTLYSIDIGEKAAVGNPSSSLDFEYFSDNLETNLTQYPKGNYISLYVGNALNDMQSRYTKLYEYIRDCNITIEYMEDRDSRLAKDVLGTAFALRGVCYYQLLRMYCEPCTDNTDAQLGVPLITKFDMEEKALRSTMTQTIDLIKSDFKTALTYHIEDSMFRFNDDVINGYLARLYFWTRDYSDAKTYALKVLEAHPLLDRAAYKTMISTQTQMSGNTIFKANRLNTSSSSSEIAGIKSNIDARPVSKRFLDIFPEGSADVRLGLSVGAKRVSVKNIFASMRSAEMQLIAAESSYHLSENDAALGNLNALRRNRITPYTDLTMSTLSAVDSDELIQTDAEGKALTPLLQAILNERRKEFFMENGDRWFELKRNGRPEFWAAKNGLKYYTRSFMYTFPIPVDDMELVAGLVQNPGYSETE